MSDHHWAEALEILQRFVPGVADFDQDKIADAMSRRGVLKWIAIPGASEMADDEVWKGIVPHLTWAPHLVVHVIADVCYSRKIPPFRVVYRELVSWLAGFSELYKDAIFGGDAFLLCEEGVVLFHHDGLFAFI